MKRLAVLLLVMISEIAFSFQLNPLWVSEVEGTPLHLALTKSFYTMVIDIGHSVGKLGFENHLYIIDDMGNRRFTFTYQGFSLGLENVICNDGRCVIFAEHLIYITDPRGKLLDKWRIDEDVDGVLPTEKGLLICYNEVKKSEWSSSERLACQFRNWDGKVLWKVADNAYYEGVIIYDIERLGNYAYVFTHLEPDYKTEIPKIFVISLTTGKIIGSITMPQGTSSVKVCNNYAVASLKDHYNVYKIVNPTTFNVINTIKGYVDSDFVISPDCKYIAVPGYKLFIYEINSGKLVLDIPYWGSVRAVTWRGDRLVVALGDGHIYMYRVSTS